MAKFNSAKVNLPSDVLDSMRWGSISMIPWSSDCRCTVSMSTQADNSTKYHELCWHTDSDEAMNIVYDHLVADRRNNVPLSVSISKAIALGFDVEHYVITMARPR